MLNSLNCNLLFPDLVLVFSWFLLENNTSLDILVDGGRRVRRPVTPSMVESEAGRRMSAARTSISDVRISSSGRPSLSELGLGKATKWYIPACSNLETEKYHKIDRLIRNIVSQNIYLMFLNQWFFLSLIYAMLKNVLSQALRTETLGFLRENPQKSLLYLYKLCLKETCLKFWKKTLLFHDNV